MPSATQLEIAAASGHGDSPEHKRFKALLGKIEKARERLQAWQQQLPVYARAHDEQLKPLLERLRASRRAWAFELEAVLAAQRWSKIESASIDQMICQLAGALLDTEEAPDPELKDLYNRHAELDFDIEAQQHLDSMKRTLEEMAGVDLGDEPVASVEDLMRRAHEQGAGQPQPDEPPSPRKPTRKTAAQRRAEADELRISQTVREVYRKLAAALHPDRIGAGVAPAERAERTARMQRANSAYEAGDLLALLTLQLEIEQVDVAHAASVAASQVKHFNKVLAEQLREIEAEIDERQVAFCSSYGIASHQRLKPGQLDAVLKGELRELAAALAELAGEQRALRGAPAVAHRWLKQKRAEMRFEEQMGELMNEHFARKAVQAESPPPARRRR